MKKTLEEHIARIKKLSLINEADSSMAIDTQKTQTTENPIDTEQFEQGIENVLKKILDNTSHDINKLGNQVGDRDGALEIQGESIDINESGIAMTIGTVLAAPKVIEMIGKGVRQLGIATKSDWIRNAGEAATNAGKKLHHTYGSTILGVLKRIPKYKNMPEETQKKIADGILLAATVAAGIASISGVSSALKAGEAGIAAVETGLTGVKGLEVGEAAMAILPRILNGLFNDDGTYTDII